MCIPGNAQNACGVGGQQCQNCAGGTCSNGSCSTASCSPANCGGCCDQNGVCQGGGTSNACGLGGSFCNACPPGSFCANGSCVTTSSCGPENCPGCCDANGLCEGGFDPLNCGQGGEQCFACGPGATCQGGGCIINNQCNPENCPGCCDFNGICQPGNQTFDCGSGGQTCSFCPANSTCQMGFCFTAPICGPQNCDGCCDQNGICQAGATNAVCGQGGESCATCPSGFTCQGNVCEMPVTNCGPSNCASGCCQANECLTGTSVGGCGTGGGACTSCPSGDTCTSGKCEVAPCSPDNCNGCCGFPSGGTVPVCLGGGAPTACGFGGNACTSCPSGTSCQGGFCQPNFDAGACGPDNCGGCCLNNVCQIGISANGCGFGGGQCSVCPAGDVCPMGSASSRSTVGRAAPRTAAAAATATLRHRHDADVVRPRWTGVHALRARAQLQQRLLLSRRRERVQRHQLRRLLRQHGDLPAGRHEHRVRQRRRAVPRLLGQLDVLGRRHHPARLRRGRGLRLRRDLRVQQPVQLGQLRRVLRRDGRVPRRHRAGAVRRDGQLVRGLPVGHDVQAGSCVASTKCGPSNCTGCCDAQGICEAGFIDTACGASGGTCEDCTSQDPPTTCDSDVTPRTCSNQQTTCPSPFTSCPAGTTTPIETQQDVCPATDLANLDEACNAGQSSTPCTSFFQFEKTSNPSCYSCLQPFNIDFNVSPQGIFECLAPFVGSQCNGETGCADLCSQDSCSMCPSAGVSACEQTVLGGI